MGKGKGSGTALALIALLIGAGGAGFGIYTWYTEPKAPQFWSAEHIPIIYPPLYTFDVLLFIELELTANSTLHLLYTGSTRIHPDPNNFADIFFKFKINDEILDVPFTRAGPYKGQSEYEYIPVTLQYVLVNSGPGIYNISVQAMSEGPGSLVRGNVFTITAYPS
jgi:hypothetical protein